MNTQQLECFLCVADKLNFTRAAEELHLTTPTVTHHIQSLENELDTKLFFRDKRSVRITESGKIFYSDATDIMDRLRLSKKHLADSEKRRNTYLKLGCTSRGELMYVSEVLKKFRAEFPLIAPQIFVNDYFLTANMLNDGQLDMMLATKDMLNGFDGFSFYPLQKCTVFAVMARDNALASRDIISLDDLDEQTIISMPPKTAPLGHDNSIWNFVLNRAHNHADIVQESVCASLALADAGYGIALLPEFVIPKKLPTDSLAKAKLSEADIFTYGIACKSGRKSKELKRMINFFQGQ